MTVLVGTFIANAFETALLELLSLDDQLILYGAPFSQLSSKKSSQATISSQLFLPSKSIKNHGIQTWQSHECSQ